MEKQAAKRRRKRRRKEEEGSIISMDRISELPQPILHHILCFLSQREAIQTCVLSKSWRYLGSTRPNFEFRERCFDAEKQTFLPLMDKILHRYHDQKLSIQKFILEMFTVDSESISFLEKWIPLVVLNMGVSTFSLNLSWVYPEHFALPSVVYKAEFLKELSLGGCKLSQINPLEEVLFKHLQKLYLFYVYIADETFENIMSSCPLIEYVNLKGCEGLKTIKVNKAHNLKEFYFNGYMMSKEDDRSIEIDAPTLESICIAKCPNWFHRHKNFPYLKCLHLNYVPLSTKSFDSFSCNHPCLEELSLHYCHGFKEFQLSSRSIKHLTIWVNRSIKAAIDATNILDFEFRSDFLPSITFTTTSSEWKSDIHVPNCSNIFIDASSWFLKLNELLMALSHSEISLNIPPLVVRDTSYNYGGVCKTVVVEKLCLRGYYSYSSFPAFLSCLFRIFHPRYIGEYCYTYAQTESEREDKQLIESLCKILLMGREKRHYLWQQDLEKASMEAFDDSGKQWHPIRRTGLSEYQFYERIRFRLKWRELEG